MSVPKEFAGRAAKIDGDGIRVLKSGFHTNKLKPGHLRGNRFRLLIRDANRALLDLQGAMANAYDLTALQHKRTTLAVQDLRCERLADATVCH